MTSPWNLPCDPLEALRDGDSGPFEDFVPIGLAALSGFFKRKGATREEAEDLSQEVLMKLVQNAPKYKPDGRFPAYVFRVGRNAWIDGQRRRGARPQLTAIEAPGPEGGLVREPVDQGRGPGHALETAEEASLVLDAVAGLSSAHREVFELGVIQELPYPEIASALEIPVGTVKSRMFHALRALRAALAVPEGADHEGAHHD